VGDRHLEVPPLERRRGKMQRPSLQNGSVQGLLQLCEVGSVATQSWPASRTYPRTGPVDLEII
jgi:hypothetical protein